MKFLSAVGALVLFFAVGATAETTNDLSDAKDSTNQIPLLGDIPMFHLSRSPQEIQGHDLAQQLCNAQPITNSAQNGIFEIRDGKGKTSKIPIKFETIITTTNWLSVYDAAFESGEDLTVFHIGNETNEFRFHAPNGKIVNLSGNETMFPFADSDFWICDLGLEFFHWPEQKLLRKEIKRSRGCSVLESTNPNPSTNGYSRVVSWIDSETLGIVQAEAYDSKNRLLKEFYPKDFKKVNGQWQVQSMEIDNVQTGSRTRLKFDLNKE